MSFGPSGVGKTHLAAAIARSLIELGAKVKFTTATALVQLRCNLLKPNFNSKLSFCGWIDTIYSLLMILATKNPNLKLQCCLSLSPIVMNVKVC